jgi:hypothetical protein
MKRPLSPVITFLLAAVLSGCAGMLDGSNEISIREGQRAKDAAARPKSAATIRIVGYSDGRNTGDARKVGIARNRVNGMSGPDIRLDRDVGEVVAESMAARLDEAGFVVLEKDDASALFELGGVVREMRCDVKERDYAAVRVESTLKEIATGKVVWSGEAEQKSDRFAGVSGNDKGDIANYLQHELNTVTGKTAASIQSTLVATRSELFGVAPGAKVIEGVSVFVTQGSTPSLNPNNTSLLKGAGVAVNGTVKPVAAEGQLSVRTEPSRAKVYLDGVYYGLSPLSIAATAGIHTVEVKLSGYRKASEKVAVRGDTTTELEFQLEK